MKLLRQILQDTPQSVEWLEKKLGQYKETLKEREIKSEEANVMYFKAYDDMSRLRLRLKLAKAKIKLINAFKIKKSSNKAEFIHPKKEVIKNASTI